MGSLGAKRSSSSKSSVDGMTGYSVVTKDGKTMQYYFVKSGDTTYYKTYIGDIPEPTPNNWTEKQMVARLKQNASSVTQKTAKSLKNEMDAYKKDREETNRFLNNDNVRNRGGDVTNRGYRNYKRATRIARRSK